MFTDLLNRVSSHAAQYIEEIEDRRVDATATAAELRNMLGDELQEQPTDPLEVIDTLAEAGRVGTVATRGPRYFGFVVGGSTPAATAADWLVSAWDQNASLYVLSPVAAIVEELAAQWVKDIVGFPPSWSAGFVTGCQMANFTCLAAARDHVLRAIGWDVEDLGLAGAPPIDVIVSTESHYTIFTALRMLGLGSARARQIETDNQGRMRADLLDAAARSSDAPCIICAQAGNVNTGAFDPLPDIAEIARERKAWLHVDGAFGLWAAVVPALRHLVKGIQYADSVATDAHKWLNVPYDCGIALTAHPESHRRALLLPAHYIQATRSERDSHEFTPEESRRARAVPVYAALRSLGRSGLRNLVQRSCQLARQMALTLGAQPNVSVLNEVVLNQVLVRFGDSDDVTRRVIAAVQQEGTCWASGTIWKDEAAMRISISNWSTTEEDIERSAAAILRQFASVVRTRD
jgi:glutamate/tyrosine decarboxylase-like PLP-dependent enzyme